MKQLTIEHLAPYLPYNVKCYANAKHFGVNVLVKELDVYMMMNILNNDTSYKIALRPLSDLTKEIEHNGEKFVPIEWLEEKYYTLSLHKECERLLEEDGYNWINHMSHLLVIHLYKWHFDTQNLIEQGLAIDLNKI